MNQSIRKDDTASFLRDPETGSRLLTKQEVLQLCGISERTLQRWRTEYGLKHYKIGRTIYYLEKDIHELLKRFQVQKNKNAKRV